MNLKFLFEELTTKPLPFKQTSDGKKYNHEYVFELDDEEYNVIFEKIDENRYEVSFGIFKDNKYLLDKTNKNKANVVFSTVYEIIKDFLKKYNPNVLRLSAVRDSKSRASIYKRALRSLAKEFSKYKARTVYLGKSKFDETFALVKEEWFQKNKDLHRGEAAS